MISSESVWSTSFSLVFISDKTKTKLKLVLHALYLDYLVAAANFAGSDSASFAQSSQQTVISFSPILTLIPPSLISQSHTGHLVAFINHSFQLYSFEFVFRERIVSRVEGSNFQILAHFA